jgi:hypothetical protein
VPNLRCCAFKDLQRAFRTVVSRVEICSTRPTSASRFGWGVDEKMQEQGQPGARIAGLVGKILGLAELASRGAHVPDAREPPLLISSPVLSFTVRHFAEHAALFRWSLFVPFTGFRMESWLQCSLRSVFTKRRTTMTQTVALEIVWRNPKPPQRRQCWEQINPDSGATHYLVQELVSTPVGSFWATTSSLEIVHGGRAA